MRGEKALLLVARDLARLGRSQAWTRIVVAAGRRFFEHARKPPQELRRKHAIAYLATRAGALAPTSYALEVHAVKVFFDALERLGLVAKAPELGLARERPRPSPRLLLSEEAVQALLAAKPPEGRGPHDHAIALRDRAILETLYGLGIRRAEVCAARVVDLDLGAGTLFGRRAKRGVSRALPLPPSTLGHLSRYLAEARPILAKTGKDDGRLFVTWRGKPLTGSTVNAIVARAAKRAGRRAHPHAFRRAVATHLVRAQVPVPAVQALLGHKRLETTATYVAIDREELRRVIAALDWPR